MNESNENEEKHLEGQGHAHHQFNPERAEEFHDPDRLKALKVNAMIDRLNINSTDHVLDLGTGSGALLPGLSRAVAKGVVIGADISERCLISRTNTCIRKN